MVLAALPGKAPRTDTTGVINVKRGCIAYLPDLGKGLLRKDEVAGQVRIGEGEGCCFNKIFPIPAGRFRMRRALPLS